MKKITHPRLKHQIVSHLLVALDDECYNILNSCRRCYCGESNLWPQFPVTLKTRVVEINVFNVYRILECVTINRKISATACVL